MFCTKCGKELEENSLFCNGCGKPVQIVKQEKEELKNQTPVKIEKEKKNPTFNGNSAVVFTSISFIGFLIATLIYWRENNINHLNDSIFEYFLILTFTILPFAIIAFVKGILCLKIHREIKKANENLNNSIPVGMFVKGLVAIIISSLIFVITLVFYILSIFI